MASVPHRGMKAPSLQNEELHEFCNLGYATKCSRLPIQRDCDAVRFSVAREQGSRLLLWFVCETDHRPTKHGTVEYDVELSMWISPHSDPRIQKMLECYVQSYLQRKIPSRITGRLIRAKPMTTDENRRTAAAGPRLTIRDGGNRPPQRFQCAECIARWTSDALD